MLSAILGVLGKIAAVIGKSALTAFKVGAAIAKPVVAASAKAGAFISKVSPVAGSVVAKGVPLATVLLTSTAAKHGLNALKGNSNIGVRALGHAASVIAEPVLAGLSAPLLRIL